MVKLSRRQFESLLFKVSNCQFVGFTALTVPDMRKKGNPHFGHTVKITRVNGVINWRYSSAVKKQLEREGKTDPFQALPRTWGQRINNCPLVCHITDDDGPQFYLETKMEKRSWEYWDTDTQLLIPEAEIKPYIKPDAPSRQGTAREVMLRDYRLDHLAELRMDGQDYRVLPLWWELAVYRPQTPETPVSASA